MAALNKVSIHRALFGRFRGKMRPIQTEVSTAMTDGRDCLITASTGSGKTEAAFLPVVERLLAEPAGTSLVRALVVSPTRALATDLHKRMSPVLEQLGLRLDVATSDKNTCRSGRPSDVLIRTPEGLDRTLCHHAGDLSGVRDVVIDEIHEFLKGPRGTQLSGLLARLDMAGVQHRRIGVSATIPDITLPARAKLVRDPVIIQDQESQVLDVHYFDWVVPGRMGAESFVAFLRELGCRKAIGFARSKRRVEDLCGWLNTGFLRDRCLVHHGSTASSIRRSTEERLRKMQVGMVVATTTLEVGIDIGDVDTCVLFDVPPDPSSFLQRAGRAGRRSGVRRVICVSQLFDRAADYARLLASIASGPARGIADARPFLAGCLQQVTSFVASADGRTMTEIEGLLDSAFGLSQRAAGPMVDGLVHAELATLRAGSVELAERGRGLLESGSIHLTFGMDGGVQVFDEGTGRRVGVAHVDGTSDIRLGGIGRRVVGIDGRGRAITRPTEGGSASFAPSARSVFELIAQRIGPTVGPDVRT